MRIGIFYLSLNKGKDRQPLVLPNGGTVYIRVEEINGDDLCDALDEGHMRPGENLMNTHYVEKLK